MRRCALGRADERRSDHSSAADHHERRPDRAFRQVGHPQGRNPAGDPPRDGRARCRTHRHPRGAWLRRAALSARRPLFEGRRALDVCARRATTSSRIPAIGPNASSLSSTATCWRICVSACRSSHRWPALAGVQTPLVKAFLAIGSAITGQDFAVTGRSFGLARPRRSRPGRIAKSSRRGFSMKPVIGCLGAGRMGRGIAVVFAFAGHQVVVVDFKEREASAFEALAAEAKAEIRSTLEILSRIDLLPAELVPTIAERITIVPRQEAGNGVAALRRHLRRNAGNPRLKQAALAEASRLAGEGPIIASTTSTILVDDLAGLDRTPRPLSQCALAQSSLSGAAGSNCLRASSPRRK